MFRSPDAGRRGNESRTDVFPYFREQNPSGPVSKSSRVSEHSAAGGVVFDHSGVKEKASGSRYRLPKFASDGPKSYF
jgi:hypothetical protein